MEFQFANANGYYAVTPVLQNYYIKEHNCFAAIQSFFQINANESVVLDTIKKIYGELEVVFEDRNHIPSKKKKIHSTSALFYKTKTEDNITFFFNHTTKNQKEFVTSIYVSYPSNIVMPKFDEFFDAIKKISKKLPTKSKIHVVVENEGQLELKDFDVKRQKINLKDNYNDIENDHAKIIKRLNKKGDKGIVILYGEPGGGKTSYIRFLITKLKKTVIYLPPDMAHLISSPKFVAFLMDHPNSILVIEDGETILKSRSAGQNQSVSNILNLSDGLLADMLNIQLIVTFNTSVKNIDSALFRQGRLICQHEFGKLSIEKAKALSERLGSKKVITEPMTLAEVYNQDEPNELATSQPKKIGFAVKID